MKDSGCTTRISNQMPIVSTRAELWPFVSTLEGYMAFFADKGERKGNDIIMEYGGIINRLKLVLLETERKLMWQHAYEIFGKQYPLETKFELQDRMDDVLLTVEVSGFGKEPDDLFVRDLMDETWVRTLLNLKSVVEVGSDLRHAIYGHKRIGVMNTGTGSGNLLIRCFEGSPAYQAGLRAGDLIRAIGDRKVHTYKAFVRELAWHSGRSKSISVYYEREGRQFRTEISLS